MSNSNYSLVYKTVNLTDTRSISRINDLQAENTRLAHELVSWKDRARSDSVARQRAEKAATQLQTDLVESQRRARILKQEIVRLAQTTRHLRERAIRSGKQMTEALSALHKLREPIPVHPPLLTRTPPRGNLKFPLRITQLHTKFSRQFKGLHMILSNLKSFNFVFKELQYRCFSTFFATYETLQTGLHPFGWKGV